MSRPEELQPAVEFVEYCSVVSMATMSVPPKDNSLGGLWPECPLLLLEFLVLAAIVFSLWLGWCDYFVGASHSSLGTLSAVCNKSDDFPKMTLFTDS